MIALLTKPPDRLKYFEAHAPHRYVELSFDDTGEVYGHAVYREVGKTAVFHFKPMEWSHKVMRQSLADFQRYKTMLKGLGFKSIGVTYTDAGDERMYKLLCAFGFGEPKVRVIAGMNI